MFDRNVLRLSRNVQLDIPIERWRCSMVRAMAHGLPGSLDKIGEILRLPHDKQKLKEGKALVQLFCKPRPKNQKLRRATRHTDPELWARFIEYAKGDIVSMREIWDKLPSWNYQGQELALWHLDQKINDRGFAVDEELVEAAIRATDREQKKLAARGGNPKGPPAGLPAGRTRGRPTRHEGGHP